MVLQMVTLQISAMFSRQYDNIHKGCKQMSITFDMFILILRVYLQEIIKKKGGKSIYIPVY